MNTPIEIIEADLADRKHAEAVTALVDAFARDPMGGGRGLPEQVRRTLVPAMQQYPQTLTFLAYQDGLAVGLAVCCVGFSTFTAKPLINLHDLFVSSGHRRQGIGRAILQRIETKAQSLGCARLTLEVRQDNNVSQRLYRSFGFAPPENFEAERVETLFWTKQLAAG